MKIVKPFDEQSYFILDYRWVIAFIMAYRSPERNISVK